MHRGMFPSRRSSLHRSRLRTKLDNLRCGHLKQKLPTNHRREALVCSIAGQSSSNLARGKRPYQRAMKPLRATTPPVCLLGIIFKDLWSEHRRSPRHGTPYSLSFNLRTTIISRKCPQSKTKRAGKLLLLLNNDKRRVRTLQR